MSKSTDLLVRIRDLSQKDTVFNHISGSDSPKYMISFIVGNLIYYFNEHSTNIQHLLEDMDKYLKKLETKNNHKNPHQGG